jgi:hypothetical protein
MFSDESLAQMAMKPGSGDERLYVEFKYHPMMNEAKSTEAGRPIYDDVEFVQILIPGDRDVYFQPALPVDKARFRRQYEDFKAGKAASESGTPLGLLPGMNEGMVQEFAYFKVRTIEALASLNDAVAGQFPGIHEWKRTAKAFVTAAEQNAPVAKVQAELEQRDVQIAQLQDQLKELAALVASKNAKK